MYHRPARKNLDISSHLTDAPHPFLLPVTPLVTPPSSPSGLTPRPHAGRARLTAGGAAAADDGHLRHAGRRQHRLVVEAAAAVLLVREQLRLQREEATAAVHQTDGRQPVQRRYLTDKGTCGNS